MLTILKRIEHLLSGPLPFKVRRNVRIEFTSSIVYGPFYAALLFIPVVLQRLGASPDMVAVYQAQTYLGLFLAALSVKVIPRRKVVFFLVVCWTLGRGAFLLTGLIPSAVGLLLFSAIFWFSDGFPGSAYTDVVRRAYPADVRGRALSVVRVGMVLAMLIFTPVVGWILDAAGHTVLFPLAGGFGVASAWLFTRMRVDEDDVQPGQSGRSLSGIWQIVRHDRGFVVYLLSVVCFGLGGLVAIAFIPAIIVDRLHLSYGEVSLLGLAQSIFWVLGLLVWGRIMDRKGAPWLLRLVYLIAAFTPICYLIAGSGWMLLPAYIASGLISGGVDLAFTNLSIEFADPERVYEYASLQRTVIGIRGLIGPFVGVLLYRIGVSIVAIFLLAAVLYLVSALLMFRPEFHGQIVRMALPIERGPSVEGNTRQA